MNNNQRNEKSINTLPREKALMALVKSGIEPAIQRVMTYLEDLDSAVSFMTSWQGGPILDLNPGQRADRWAATQSLSRRAEVNPAFRLTLLKYPRYVAAMIAQESSGLKPIDFLWQVNEVKVVEEEPGIHWLILPACHLGCGTPEGKLLPLSTGACAVCGKPQELTGDCQPERASAPFPSDHLHKIDEYIIRSISADTSSRARLLKDPASFFVQASLTLLGVRPQEEFGIHEVKVASDTDTLLYVVLLANHQSSFAKEVNTNYRKYDG